MKERKEYHDNGKLYKHCFIDEKYGYNGVYKLFGHDKNKMKIKEAVGDYYYETILVKGKTYGISKEINREGIGTEIWDVFYTNSLLNTVFGNHGVYIIFKK